MSEQELKKLEDKLWAAADKMRGAVSVSDYKFIVLGLIFLKYISDSFEEKAYPTIHRRHHKILFNTSTKKSNTILKKGG